MSTALSYRIVPDRRPQTPILLRMADAVRSLWRGPLTNQELAGLYRESRSSTSGVAVSESTALNYSAVYAAINLIASDVGSLPLHLFKRLPNGGKEQYLAHPLFRLLRDQPNPEQSSVAFRRTIQAHALAYGNGYAQIIRNGGGTPVELWPLTPERVTPFRRSVDAPLQYRVLNESGGGDTIFDLTEILHIAGLGYDGTMGYSVIQKARESIGLGLAAEAFGSTFFANGASFGGVISYPGARPNELAEKNYRESLLAQHQGSQRAHKFLMLYGGAKYERIGIPPDDAQFLESRQFQTSEVARFFNVPPHKIGDLSRSTNNNIEQQARDYYTTTLIPWLTTWEQELTNKLVASLERNIQFVQHNVDGILRGDSAARGSFYGQQFNVASITPNEIREFENRNPVEGGDRSFVALNLIPLDKVDAWYDAQIEKTQADAKKLNADAVAAATPPPAPATPDPAVTQALQRELDRVTAERDAAIESATEAVDRALTQAADWATREGERVAQLAERAELVGRLTRDLETSLTEAARVEAERTQWQARAQDAAGAVTALTADLEFARAAQAADGALREEARAALDEAQRVSDRERLRAEAAELEEIDLRTQLATRTTELADEGLVRNEAEAALASEREARLKADAVLVAVTGRADTAEAIVAELRAQVTTFTADQTLLTIARDEINEARWQAKAEADRIAAALTEATARAETRAAEVVVLETRTQATQHALREVLTRAVGYIVDRESDRARRQQGTPEKLRNWAADFYPVQEDFYRAALRPAVVAWLVASGSAEPIEAVLDRSVPEFLTEGQRQLTRLAADSTPETLAPALERVLRRWETERVTALVDRLTSKEAAHD